MSRLFLAFSIATLFAVAGTNLSAQMATLTPTQDTGFLAAGFVDGVPFVADRNFGGHDFVPVAHANNDRVNRSVFQFDIAGNVPAGSTVTSAAFAFEVTQQGGGQGQTGQDFELHRVTTAWTEGTGIGAGGEATGDGATWAMATATVSWTTPGGDFDATPLGAVLVDGPTSLGAPVAPVVYTISSAELALAVQDIVDGTATDNGFLLKGASEIMADVAGSAARVTSREGATAATLTIEFSGGMVLLGDLNTDGAVDLLDVAPFVALILDGGFQAEGDLNGDSAVDLLDVAGFVALILG